MKPENTFKWIHIGEKPFYENLTLSYAAMNLGADILMAEDFFTRKIGVPSGLAEEYQICTFSGAFLKMHKSSVHILRKCFPAAKMISLGSDSIVYLKGRKEPGLLSCKDYEFNSPEAVDLHLDTMNEVVEAYRKRGINCQQWWWTASELFLDSLQQDFKPLMFEEKPLDFYSLIAVKTQYRTQLKKIIEGGSHSIIGPNEPNLMRVFADYTRSKIILGTTSGSWTGVRTMKGFRDWIGPVLGTPLIYDQHEDTDIFPASVKRYNYLKIEEVFDILDYFKKNPDEYYAAIKEQTEWAYEHSLEKQLTKIFTEGLNE